MIVLPRNDTYFDRFLSVSEISRIVGMDRATVVAVFPIIEFTPRKKGMFESQFREFIRSTPRERP